MTYQDIVRAVGTLTKEERESIVQLLGNEPNHPKVAAPVENSRDDEEFEYVDGDGNVRTYRLRDLFWSQDAYEYLKEQQACFKSHLPDLIDRYAGKFIVFENGRVIDHDRSEDVLLDRISETDFFRDRSGILCVRVPIA